MEILKKINNGRETSFLKIELRYNKGGFNTWTGKTDKRGYFLHVTPVDIEITNGVRIETFFPHTGAKMLIKEVKKQTEKAYQLAKQMAETEINGLCQYVLSTINK